MRQVIVSGAGTGIGKATAAAFAELGVDRLVIIPNPKDDDVRPSIDAALAAVAGL